MIRFVRVDGSDPERVEVARELFQEYQRELGIDLSFQSFADELATLPGKYAPPQGALLLVFDDEQAIACGAIRPLGDGAAELKRIYVRPAGRRRGLARKISEELVAFGKSHGYAAIRLDTLRRLEGAIPLYRALGFEEIPAYNFNPEEDIVYMELTLDPIGSANTQRTPL